MTSIHGPKVWRKFTRACTEEATPVCFLKEEVGHCCFHGVSHLKAQHHLVEATGTSDWPDNKFVEGGSPGVDPWLASTSDPDASLNKYFGLWDQGSGGIVDWEAYWRMCSDLPIALAGNEIGTLGGTILSGNDISWSRSWYMSFLFLRRRSSSRRRITAMNMTTPPTAPPAIAPVDAPLCSADDKLDPSVPDELSVGAFWMIT